MTLANTILVPGVFVTIDNSKANTALGGTFKTVLFGQKIAAGTATADTFTQVFSDSDAKEKFGVGSILANMFSEWFANNSINEVYAVALDDAGAAKATSIIAILLDGTATASGTLYSYINGTRFAVPVAAGDTPTVAGDALAAAINADVDIPVIALNIAGSITLTAKNGGTLGNSITNLANMGAGEASPEGMSFVANVLTSGASDPDINDAIAALPDEVINVIVNPYTDSTSLTALSTELARRWGNTVQIDGHAIMAFSGTASELVTEGGTLNSEFFTMIDSGKETMVPAYLVAPELGGRVSESADADPARPFRTLPLTGMIGDAASDRRTFSDKNSILNAGLSTHNVQNDGTAVIDRLVTTYKTNAVGAEDTSYQNTNTLFNISFMRQSYRVRMLSLYPRHKLADDGTRFGAGQPIATPSSIKGDTIALYQEWIDLGLAEDIDTFADSLTVERDSVNRSRVNVVMQPILIGQLYQFDTTLQFIV
jgi:phage tail sheath gpL-like